MTLTVKVDCNMKARDKNTPALLAALNEAYEADGVDPLAYKCLRCKLAWDCSPLDDYRNVVCSGCYGENVLLTLVRIAFSNWGEQNGGEAHQRRRYNKAIRASNQ